MNAARNSAAFAEAVREIIGSRPVRSIAEATGLHRATVYEMRRGVVVAGATLYRFIDALGVRGEQRVNLLAAAGIVEPKPVLRPGAFVNTPHDGPGMVWPRTCQPGCVAVLVQRSLGVWVTVLRADDVTLWVEGASLPPLCTACGGYPCVCDDTEPEPDGCQTCQSREHTTCEPWQMGRLADG